MTPTEEDKKSDIIDYFSKRGDTAVTAYEVELIVDAKLRPLEDKIDNLMRMVAKLEGAGMLLKIFVLSVVPVTVAVAWVKEHIKF